MLFDLLGDREATAFFAKMGTAGYAEREQGHTGNFFNILWAMPGVARCGPLATGAYWKEQSWYYDLARGPEGGFAYQGSPAGEEEHGKYTNWDCTGAYLLAYALPLKSLDLTGKKPCPVPALSAGEVAEVAHGLGVRAGMGLGEVIDICPTLSLIPPAPSRNGSVWQAFLARLEAIGAEVESLRNGEAFFRADEIERLYGGLEGVLAVTSDRLGKSVRIGAAPTRLAAFAVAGQRSEGQPGGVEAPQRIW